MIRIKLFVAVAMLVFPLSSARADSWAPFGNFRQVDATGRFYLVVKKAEGAGDGRGSGTPITFEMVERKAGTPRVEEVTDSEDFGKVTPNPDVRVRDGDLVRGRGTLERCPLYTLSSPTGLGFVGIDVRGYNYGRLRSGDAVVIMNADGTVRHRKDLLDLFDGEEIAGFQRTAGGVFWSRGGWIDERRRQVVVVSAGYGPGGKPIQRLFRVVSIETGHVGKGSTDEILTALADRNRGALDLALELTAELKLKGALQHLPDILDNRQFPLATQLRCAVALATLGDRRGAELIRKAALEKTEEQYYAIKNLPIVIGDGAAPVLCDAVRRYENRCTFPACQAMFSVSSEAAVPELLKLLDAKGSVASRKFAAECLFYKGPAARAAVPRLIKLLQEDPEMDGSMSARELAAVALGAIGPDAKEALPVLIRLAEVHAKDEWSLVKNKQPKLLPDHFGGEKYSDDYFVDAICKIRRK